MLVISFFYIMLLCLHKFYDILFLNFLYLHLLEVVLMVKILLADTDTKRNSASYQFLSNEKDFEIESTNSL